MTKTITEKMKILRIIKTYSNMQTNYIKHTQKKTNINNKSKKTKNYQACNTKYIKYKTNTKNKKTNTKNWTPNISEQAFILEGPRPQSTDKTNKKL